MFKRHRRVRLQMDLVLYPRAAPQDCLRVWLGVFAATAAPALDWRLNGAPVVPTSLRQVARVRPDAMLPPGMASAEVPRAFTRVHACGGWAPGTLYTISG